MFFLRLAIFLIIVLGGLVYLISARIRAEFINAGEKVHPTFRDHSSVFKAFCRNPPTPHIEKLVKLKKRLTIALLIAVLAFAFAILSVVYEQMLKEADHSINSSEIEYAEKLLFS
jgi:hypothetical protein